MLLTCASRGRGIKRPCDEQYFKAPKCKEKIDLNQQASVPALRSYRRPSSSRFGRCVSSVVVILSASIPRSVLPSQRNGHYRGNSTHGEHGSKR